VFVKALRRSHDERGAALVEFALVLPLLLILVFGMLEFGKAFNYWIDTTHLANEGARWAVVNYNPGAGTLQEYVKGQANTVELRDGGTSSIPAGDEAEVCISFPNGSANVGDPVHVTVTATYHWIPFVADRISSANVTISGSATMRLEAQPTNYGEGCA
jgi:Flp pilus assembly protein TadG